MTENPQSALARKSVRWLMAALAILLVAAGVAGAKTWWPTTIETRAAQPSETKTVERTVTVTVEAPVEEVVEIDFEAEKLGREYLESDNRRMRYDEVFQVAAKKVAKGLECGKFGSLKRYDQWKTPLHSGYTGEGGISTTDNSFYAWVYWIPGKKVDYKALVGGFAVSGPLGTVHIEGQDLNGPYRVSVTKKDSKLTQVSSAEFRLANDKRDDAPASYPKNLNELKQLDTDALAVLDAAMTFHFGPNWRTN